MIGSKRKITPDVLKEKAKAAFLAYAEDPSRKEIFDAIEAWNEDIFEQVMSAYLMGYINGWGDGNS